MTKISIIGSGYVGLVSGTCLAENGHEVICADISKEKIEMLKQGKSPIHEPGLEEKIRENMSKNRLKFTTNIDNAILKSKVIFSAVGTPMGENHEADLRYVKEVAKSFAKNLNEYKIFVNKSTVPVGTGKMVKKIIESHNKCDFDIVSNPEFLKEGAAVNDFMNPDRIVIGAENQKAEEIMKEVYKPFERAQSPIIYTSIESAEMSKYASNAMLATRISFMNELSILAEKLGANIKEVAKIMGEDDRIGPRFLQAGAGYGGSCFPKDVAAIIESASQVGIDLSILRKVEEANSKQKTVIVDKLENKLGDLNGKQIAMWGLSFKPKTDDVREAPAFYIAQKLNQLGAKVVAYDPVATENFKESFPNVNVEYVSSQNDALSNSDALLLVTEWNDFRSVNLNDISSNLKGNILIDGRNIYDRKEAQDAGLIYEGIGR